MSLEVKQVGTERYICNRCGIEYDIRDALIRKGNTYFCGMKCVLEYEGELTRDETKRSY